MLMHMMLYKGGKIHNIPEVMSCYRVTGRGIWSERTAEEQAGLQKQTTEYLSQTVPLKYKVLCKLHSYWQRFKAGSTNLTSQ
jgi:hypothetical protein